MDKGKLLAERVRRLRDLALAKDGKGSELNKNAMSMVITYEPAKIWPPLMASQGCKVGNKFFQTIPASSELSVAQTVVFNTWSQDKSQLFVLRHEVEHMSAANLKLVSHYRLSNIPVESIPRHKLTFELKQAPKHLTGCRHYDK
jgi:hypothetical protein